LVFGDEQSGFDVLPFVWLPGDDVQAREDEDRLPYATWIRQGHLLTFAGRASTDPKTVARTIAELHGKYHIEALAFDRWRIEDLRRELDEIGCDVELVEFGQGFKDMAPAVDKLERLVAERKLRHANHPLLAMAVTNAKIESDAVNNRKFTKKRSTGRIDPIVALAMALAISDTPAKYEPKYQMLIL
jgi:phage terminase large subunit-like protein